MEGIKFKCTKCKHISCQTEHVKIPCVEGVTSDLACPECLNNEFTYANRSDVPDFFKNNVKRKGR